MTQNLIVRRAPPGISLQDSGRTGHLRDGVAAAGPMDWAHHAMANRILGKPVDAVAIEIGPAGIDLELEQGELQLSFAGPRYRLRWAGKTLNGPLRLTLQAGQILEIVPQAGAMWGYVGLQGHLGLEKLMGSYAENTVNGLGVMPIRPDTRLPVSALPISSPAMQAYIDPMIMQPHSSFGILPSSQYDHFSDQAKAGLVDKSLTISARYDRMAYRLEGVQVRCEQGYDILSDGVTMGAIQVPGDGRPFVLMADHQPTGGYPKIACLCQADLPRFAQITSGQPFNFTWVSVDQAMQSWKDLRTQIEQLTPLRGIRL